MLDSPLAEFGRATFYLYKSALHLPLVYKRFSVMKLAWILSILRLRREVVQRGLQEAAFLPVSIQEEERRSSHRSSCSIAAVPDRILTSTVSRLPSLPLQDTYLPHKAKPKTFNAQLFKLRNISHISIERFLHRVFFRH